MITLLISTLLLGKPSIQQTAAATTPLTAGQIVDLPLPGRFDYMAFDPKYNLVLASHTGAKTLVAYNVKTKKVQELPTGGVNGVEAVPSMGMIYAGGGGQIVVAIDEKTLKILNTLNLTGPGDSLAVDTKRGHVFLCHDDATEDWVFGSKLTPLTPASVTIAGAPEAVVYDKKDDVILQLIKDKNQIQVIDPSALKVTQTYSSLPAESPHGMVVDSKLGLAIVAGSNGKIVSFNTSDGSMVSSADIAQGVDQIAYDPRTMIVYCACRGRISAVKVSATGLTPLGDVDSPRGAHTITVDTNTHDVWVCYAGSDSKAHLQSFHPAP